MNDIEKLEAIRQSFKKYIDGDGIIQDEASLFEEIKNIVDTPSIPDELNFMISATIYRRKNNGYYPFGMEVDVPTVGVMKYGLNEKSARNIFEIFGKKDENECNLSPLKGKGKCGADNCGCRCQQNRENTHIDVL